MFEFQHNLFSGNYNLLCETKIKWKFENLSVLKMEVLQKCTFSQMHFQMKHFL
jgi:hypothetical protein